MLFILKSQFHVAVSKLRNCVSDVLSQQVNFSWFRSDPLVTSQVTNLKCQIAKEAILNEESLKN